MFDFQKLTVYSKAVEFKIKSDELIANSDLSKSAKDQLDRASLSIAINIAEGSGRFSKPDKRRFYVFSRASAYECASLLDIYTRTGKIDFKEGMKALRLLEEVSKMLFKMIDNLSSSVRNSS